MKLYVQMIKGKDGSPLVAVPRQRGSVFDLMAATNITIKKGELKKIRLGMKIYIPKGFQALITPKNGTYDLYSLVLVDSPIYKFNSKINDELSLIGMAVNDITIKQGDRIATLEMQPKQNATVWQKLQWLFTKWKVKVVDDINER